MGFDVEPYVAGVVSTIIGSVVVAFFVLWIQTRESRRRTLAALFAEIRQNRELLKSLLSGGEVSHRHPTLPIETTISHWSLMKLQLSDACFEHARRTGFLYGLRPNLYQEITKAYSIVSLINREGYDPQGTARASFKVLDKILSDLVELLPT